MTWADGPMLAFDTESTSALPESARIVTAAAVYIGPTGPGKRKVQTRDWLVDPGIPIPAEATAIHGVTDEQAAAGQAPADALGEIVSVLRSAWTSGVPVVGFNVAYDLTLLSCELARNGLPPLEVGHVIDPLVIDRAVDKYRKGKRTLDITCQFYKVALDGAHEAGADAIAAARLAWRLAAVFPALVGEISLAELHEKQAGWSLDWQTHFEQYLRTKGGQPDAVVERGWPVRVASQSEQAVA